MSSSDLKSPLIRPFYPALDGLRAIAFLAVFFNHYAFLIGGGRFLWWGGVGVDLFFVISGFLITGILYDTLHRQDYFRNFYIRRALRIFPLYFGFWIIILLLTPVLRIGWNRYLLAEAFYIGNFFYSGMNLGLHASPALIPFTLKAGGQVHQILVGHFWTLCVEEQFYLIWPAVIFLVRSRRALLRICLIVIVAEPFARLAFALYVPHALTAGTLYFATEFRIDSLLTGAAIALWLRGPSPTPAFLRRGSLCVLPSALFLLVLGYNHESSHLHGPLQDFFTSTFGYTLVALCAAAVLLLALGPITRYTRLLTLKPLSWLGRISYGLYFFHALPVYLLMAWAARFPPRTRHPFVLLAVLLLSILTAWLSFRFWESPFLRLKSRLAPRPGIADPPPYQEPGIT